jgi:hypothetical protein
MLMDVNESYQVDLALKDIINALTIATLAKLIRERQKRVA